MDLTMASTAEGRVWETNPASKATVKDLIPRHVALIGNFPPRRCGIATFTGDVYDALTTDRPGVTCDVYAMDDGGGPYAYPEAVIGRIRQDHPSDYVDTARRINASGATVVLLQHEFGIFGGDAGESILRLVSAVKAPVVVTLHTVLERPDPAQRRVMRALIDRSARLVVMAAKGRDILCSVYDAPADKITIIPHGAHDRPFVNTDDAKPAFGLEGRKVMLTFGLLSPNKGLEVMIRALPRIVARHPDVTYLVLGATHPHLVAREGEAFRDGLMAQARDLGVGDNIQFVNRFVDTDLLLDYLSAADLYVTPYLHEAQITSGTLSYAVALGKAVISTPYWHAKELLADGHGVLTPFGDSDALADAAIALLDDDDARLALQRRAYAAGRQTIWSKVGDRYMTTFAEARSIAAQSHGADGELVALPQHARLRPPPPNLTAVLRLTDDCGIAQHSLYGVPDRRHGYCLDDAARALILAHDVSGLGTAAVSSEQLAWTCAAFVQHAWNPDRGRFRNFMSFERRWLEEVGSDDSFGRAVWSLGVTAGKAARSEHQRWAIALLQQAAPHVLEFPAPRTSAYAILGLVHADELPGRDTLLRELADRVQAHLINNAEPDWPWFEDHLSYDNARLPEALIRAGVVLEDKEMTARGVAALEWLAAFQTAPSGCFRPVGTEGFGHARAQPAMYDQQPLEAAATVDACAAAFEATGHAHWIAEARRAYGWFLGANDLGERMANLEDGGCFDGLERNGPNFNQGAESVLAFQMSTCAMHRLAKAQPAQAAVVARH
jgi:glycosyltransferase involved in cell wall biosynthesis